VSDFRKRKIAHQTGKSRGGQFKIQNKDARGKPNFKNWLKMMDRNALYDSGEEKEEKRKGGGRGYRGEKGQRERRLGWVS